MSEGLQAEGSLWLSVDGQALGTHGRLGLLKAVAQEGSITRAAKVYGLSYKAAWDAIHAMNSTAREPLVERVTGGKGGGRTVLTPYGQRLLARYDEVEAIHARFLQHLASAALDLDRPWSLLHAVNVKTSARNQWVAEVVGVSSGRGQDGATEVLLRLPSGERLSAAITAASVLHLDLAIGGSAIVMIKAPAVGVHAPGIQSKSQSQGHRHSNRWSARVISFQRFGVRTEVVVESEGGLQWVASISTQPSADGGFSANPLAALDARVEVEVSPSDVMLGTLA